MSHLNYILADFQVATNILVQNLFLPLPSTLNLSTESH